ncbi:hypothetical protein [Streptomyces flavidovirens]|uniref:hypothetical protein n=1 Tax=Streptomyces flavidovirens TaxID=67298 RepID=UPI0036D0E52F
MKIREKLAAAGTTVLLTAAALASTTGVAAADQTGAVSAKAAGNSAVAAGCYGIGGGKYNCNVWKTAPTYFAGNVRAGTLYAGTNYFYCQAKGSTVHMDGYSNDWWAKTDDDSGNRNVWVNVVYLSGGGNYEPVPGLPWC